MLHSELFSEQCLLVQGRLVLVRVGPGTVFLSAPGYPRFSGSLASTFLPMSHLDHHSNSSVLYGQHRFYDTQKDNFYLRSLPSQPTLLSANHGFPAISRAAPGHPLGSCSRERDSGGGSLHKSLKEGGERGVALGSKEKERASKQEAKERQQQHQQQQQQQQHHQHHHHQQQQQQQQQQQASLEEESNRALERHKASLPPESGHCKEDSLGRGKHLSACLVNAKMLNGESGGNTNTKSAMLSCGGGGAQTRHVGGGSSSRCAKNGNSTGNTNSNSGEMRLSGHPQDCLESRQMLHHSYSVPPPLSMSSATGAGGAGGFPCLQLHTAHPHHPHHHHHHHHPHHPDFYCPPPPPPLTTTSSQDKGGAAGRELKVTGPTFVPSVGHLGDKNSGPFQLDNPDCRGGGGGSAKDRTLEKNNGHNNGAPPNSCQRKQQQQPYGKADKASDWLQSHHHHLQQQQQQQQQQQNQSARSRSLECINSADMDLFRPSLPQGAKGGHSGKSGPYISTPPFQDCSHSGPAPTTQSSEGLTSSSKGGQHQGRANGSGCTLERGGQKVARIRHQQHRPGPEAGGDLGNSGQEMKRKLELASLGYGNSEQQHLPHWAMRGQQIQAEEEQRKNYLDPFSSGSRLQSQQNQNQQQQQQQQQGMPPHSSSQQETQASQGESSAMKSLLKYSSQQQPLLLAQKSPFGGLGSLKTPSNSNSTSCALQDAKQPLPPRKGPPHDSERQDCGGGRSREAGDGPHGEGEVRQPPVGIAVAVARQREPQSHPPDGHPGHSRQGRVLPAMKGVPRSVFSLDAEGEERKRLCEDQLGLPCLDRDRELFIRESKERVEFARIHPSSSCHGDLTPHLMVPGGTSLQASQLGADPAAHAHPAHHHWMPRTGSPSLWMTGHSYGLSHAALHQNLPPGFSAAMPSPLQPVLPLPQDPSAQLVVLPSEPPAHPATHHLGTPQRKPEDPPMELEDLLTQRTLKSAKPFSYTPAKSVPPPAGCAARLSPCSRTPSLRPHPKSTPCTPCPAPSPATAPRSPALSPAPSHTNKGAEPQDKRGEGQPPQDYPQSLEPDLPPGYTYPAVVMGYSNGPSPQDVRLAEPADLQAMQTEPAEPSPRPLPLGEESACEEGNAPLRTLVQEEEAGPGTVEPGGGVEGGGVEGCCTSPELESSGLFHCPGTEGGISELPAPSPTPPTSPSVGQTEVEGSSSECAQVTESGEERKGEEEKEEEGKDGPVEGGESKVYQDLMPAGDTPSSPEAVADTTESGRNSPSEAPGDTWDSPSPQGDTLTHNTSGDRADRTMVAGWLPGPNTGLDLLIAASLSAEGHISPTPPIANQPQTSGFHPCSGSHGIALLSELVDLELQQQRSRAGESEGAELLTFDLQSLATLAAARSLELGLSSPSPGRPCHARRAFNLRRECSWTPRHEPVCPVKSAMDRMDSQEVEMRMRLADLQRQYKEKQRELAKLQRRHDHQKEEKSRSPARRGPGRPRKRKPAPGSVSTPGEGGRRVKSLGAGLGLLCEELGGGGAGGEVKRKKNKLSEFERLSTSQMKARCKQTGPQVALSSKQARKASQLKQNAKVQRGGSGGTPFRRREASTPSSAPPRLSRGQGTPRAEQKRVGESVSQTDTARCIVRASYEMCTVYPSNSFPLTCGVVVSFQGSVWTIVRKRSGRKDGAPLTRTASAAAGHHPPQRPLARGRGRPGSRQPKQEVVMEKETSRSESESSEEEEQDEWSYDNDEGDDDIIAPPSKDPTPSSALLGPSPSSVVKLEANQKAKKKKERQGLLGSLQLPVAEGEGEVKVRKQTPSRPGKRRNESRERDGEKRAKGLRHQQQEQSWTDPSARSSLYRASTRVHPSSTPSERLRKATRKNKALQGSSKQKKISVLGGALSPRRLECVSSKDKNNSKLRSKPLKGRAVSRLLESFAADEGFQIDEDSSFSEEEEEEEENESAPLCSPRDRSSTPTIPNCTLTKESLVDGLKVLILKEDDLLYAAYIHTLQPPDIYSIMIEGERGNRPRIYSLEQLLQEAVLDVRPQLEQELTSGTRVCAYWSERSRCLYPGYVRRGGPNEEEKEGSVMVEFDDGDSGRISLSNIRLLPPDYQIQSTEPSPAMLISNGRRKCRKAALEKTLQGDSAQRASPERQSHTEPGRTQGRRTASKGKTGKVKTANSGINSTASGSLCKSNSSSNNSSPLLSWPGVALPKKRTPHKMGMGLQNLFQLNGNPRKMSKSKETGSGGFTLHPLSTPPSTPAKTIFSSSFEVDSFSSIANGYSSFGSQAGLPLSPRNNTSSRGKRLPHDGGQRGRKAGRGAEFLVKLDHEGVTSPKTKNGKALLLLGNAGSNGRVEKGFGAKEVVVVDASPVGYTHPVLLVKDNKKGGGSRADLLLKGTGHLRKPPASSLGLGEYSEFGMNCDSDCHSSYSDMDEEDDEEEDDERNTGLRNAGRFLSQLSVSSTSSVSSSSSSSGSLSSSSLCSSDNDSSYSSEDEEDTLLLQSCLSSHPSVPTALLQPPEPPANAGSFVAKAMAVSSSKPLKRKESPSSSSLKTAKDLAKRQRLPSVDNGPKISNFLPARQLWRWSGNPTQRRGMKGKARKLFYKAIVRGKEAVHVGDCAVFLSAGRPHLPYIGRIESFWESWASNMVVKVKWFYHPEETKLGKRHRDGRHALYQSCHEDENDVQTISHKCQVVNLEEYECLSQGRKHHNGQDLYYLAGTYDPTTGQLVTAQGVSILC
ncbi:BAH and coiled-coil domain-containing protein 1 [Acipenser ruthenus]|uniref:BAH and coiled-coil domain-containing protein 1 n=1 Tax=Acipenser ruthenus TaxID=7906 RepID=A0A444UQC9_ACIRT|nr:BAH and coiled-coil domain-containing protein 1 [Acipenser ruthenus]